jgi:site-specific recombinase XerD
MVQYDFVYNRKKKLNRDGKSLVQLRCYKHGKSKYYGTDVRIQPEYWDNEKHVVKKRHPKAPLLNRLLREKMGKYEQFELDMMSHDKPFQMHMFDVIDKVNNTRFTFNEFAAVELDVSSIRNSTKRQQRVFLNKINEFKPNSSFEEIDIDYCQKFEGFLKMKGLNPNSIAKEFKNFKKFVNLAINKGYIKLENYPFRKFKVKTVPTRKVFLGVDEVNSLELLELSYEEELEEIRDIYLFGVYTGLRFSDILDLSCNNLKEQNNEPWLEVKMNKTNSYVLLPICLLSDGKPKFLIDKYKKKGRSTIFRRYTNQHVNRTLKALAKMANINKRLSFHSSRHTFGTGLLNQGLPIESVQKLMGHSSIAQTMEYAELLGTTIEKQLRNLTLNSN